MTFELEDYYFERHIVYNVTVLFAEVNFYQILHLHRCIYYRQFVLVSQSNILFSGFVCKAHRQLRPPLANEVGQAEHPPWAWGDSDCGVS